jgi:hypothetical protein
VVPHNVLRISPVASDLAGKLAGRRDLARLGRMSPGIMGGEVKILRSENLR